MHHYKFLMVERFKGDEGDVVRLTFNKPERLNVLDAELGGDLNAALDEIEGDDDVKCVILRGSGRAFSAGYDLQRVYLAYGAGTGRPEDRTRRPSERIRLQRDRQGTERLRKLFLYPKVTIAQVHGTCIGGGLYTALCCDMTIAAEDAQISHAEQRLGFSGTMFVFPLEVMLIGYKRSRELLLTGRTISGKEAADWGLVNRSVPTEALDEETLKLAKAVALMPRDGLAIGKAFAELTYDAMGLTQGFAQGYIGHSFFTNVRYEPGEFNFIRERRDKGHRQAFHDRDARYSGLV